jgi:hypothetical protein
MSAVMRADSPNSDQDVFATIDAVDPTFWSSVFGSRPWLRRGIVSSGGLAAEIEQMLGWAERMEEARSVHDLDGHPSSFWFLHHADQYVSAIGHLNEGLKRSLSWPGVDASVIKNTTASTTGAHFDDANVLLFQLSGDKRIRIWPLLDLAPERMRERIEGVGHVAATAYPPGQIVADVTVKEGDVLHIPAFWGHKADGAQASLTLSFGIRTRPGPRSRPALTRDWPGFADDQAAESASRPQGMLVTDPQALADDIAGRMRRDLYSVIRAVRGMQGASGVEADVLDALEQAVSAAPRFGPDAIFFGRSMRAYRRLAKWGPLPGLADDLLRTLLRQQADTGVRIRVVCHPLWDLAVTPQVHDKVTRAVQAIEQQWPPLAADLTALVHTLVVSESSDVLRMAASFEGTVGVAESCLDSMSDLLRHIAGAVAELVVRANAQSGGAAPQRDPQMPSGFSHVDAVIQTARARVLETLRQPVNVV